MPQVWKELKEPCRLVPYKNLEGLVVGELTVLRAIDRREQGGVVWLCQCACGNKALRTSGQLNQAKKLGAESACHTCNKEATDGLFIDRREKNRTGFAEHFVATGYLYSQRFEEKEIEACFEELERIGIPLIPDHEIVSEPLYIDPGAKYSNPHPKVGQLTAFLVPIHGRQWSCESCVSFVEEGFQCAACLNILCCGCVELEVHRCAESSNGDWEKLMRTYSFERYAAHLGKSTSKRRRYVDGDLTLEQRLIRIQSEDLEDLRLEQQRLDQEREFRAQEKRERAAMREAKAEVKRRQRWEKQHAGWFEVLRNTENRK